MSDPHSAQLSGVGNPYVEVLDSHFLVNADNQIVKRTAPHPCEESIMRFLKKIRVSEILFYCDTPCWEWVGCITPKTGYGQFRFDGRRGSSLSSPHRFAYMYFVGDVEDGYEVDHLCRNRRCCSPLHLEVVTVQVNRKRRGQAKTHCVRNHEYTPETTYVTPKGSRQCRICLRENQKAFHKAKPDAQQSYRE